MNPTFKNILAVVAGCAIGMLVNYGIITLGTNLIPAPAGVDPNDVKSIADNMHKYEFKHFMTPFFGHALGTLAGAFTAAKMAASYKMGIALAIGGFFLLGGIAMVMMLPAPTWFNVLDLGMAYIPMGWLGAKLASSGQSV